LVSARLILRPVPWAAVRAINAGHRLEDWAGDYPGDGDVVIAGLLQGADQAVGLEAGQAATGQAAGQAGAAFPDEAWGHRQVVEQASGLVVGGIGFFGPPHGGEAEIGYGIVPSRQGRGYATEALRTMIAMAWADSRVRAVVAGTDPGNVASQRVLEKAGFRRIAAAGEFRYQLTRPA
jgi:GNAT superfamily N-acetyltransferase